MTIDGPYDIWSCKKLLWYDRVLISWRCLLLRQKKTCRLKWQREWSSRWEWNTMENIGKWDPSSSSPNCLVLTFVIIPHFVKPSGWCTMGVLFPSNPFWVSYNLQFFPYLSSGISKLVIIIFWWNNVLWAWNSCDLFSRHSVKSIKRTSSQFSLHVRKAARYTLTSTSMCILYKEWHDFKLPGHIQELPCMQSILITWQGPSCTLGFVRQLAPLLPS